MKKKSYSPFAISMKKFSRNKMAMISLFFLILVAIISIIAPLIAPLPINKQDLLNIKGDMSVENLLGTDAGGRDNFSRLLYAGRISLAIGFTSTIGMLLIGISIGVISGYFGGIIDTLLMRVTEFVMLFPFLIFAIVLNAALGDKIKNPYGFLILSPNAAFNTIAKIRKGNSITNSVTLISNVSIIPPKYPEITPIEIPIKSIPIVEVKPIANEILPAYKSLLKLSLPPASVPKRFSTDISPLILSKSCLLIGKGAISGAIIEIIATKIRKNREIIAILLRENFFIEIANGE